LQFVLVERTPQACERIIPSGQARIGFADRLFLRGVFSIHSEVVFDSIAAVSLTRQ
jgi:hypothetical protein